MVDPEELAQARRYLDGLSDEEIRRIDRGEIVPDEFAFIESLQIEDKVSGGLIDFKLWEFQKELVATLNEHDWTFVLKARQLGVTWVVEAHLLYLATFWGDRLFLIFSQTGGDAIDALGRIRTLHDSMPAQLAAGQAQGQHQGDRL